MTTITSLLFDLDGTLINSIDAHLNVIIDIAKKHDVHLSKNEFTHYNGMGTKEGFKKIMREKHIKFRGLNLADFVIDRLRREKEIEDAILIYPQTKNMLAQLQKEYMLAVATSSDKKYLKKIIQRFSLQDYFTAYSTINDVHYGKPAPDIFIKAAQRLRVQPEQCLVIEDSINGVIAAKRAGMKVIAVLSTTKKELFVGEAKPHLFVNNIGEITKKNIMKLE